MAQIHTISKQELSFRDHLNELRRRVLICLGVVAVGMGLGWAYHEKLTKILQKPLGQQLYFSDPAGGLGFVVQISLFAGVLFAIPIIIYQLLQFIRPLHQKFSTRMVMKYVFISFLLATVGVAFAYFLSLPAALKFLLEINSGGVSPLIMADKYLTFVMTYLASSALIFQLPLIFLFINRIKPFSGGTLMKLERPVIIISFIISAILTPTPDPINQTIMALPMIFLYQVAVVGVLVSNKVRKVSVKTTASGAPIPTPPIITPAPAPVVQNYFPAPQMAPPKPTSPPLPMVSSGAMALPATIDLSESTKPILGETRSSRRLPNSSIDLRNWRYS